MSVRLDPAKFRDPLVTATGETRASVNLHALKTLWFNTGTLCNITCRNCYIESSPRNDRLAYLSLADVLAYLDEIATAGFPTRLIGFTGGEPFMNRAFPAMLDAALSRGFDVLVLTNAMKPMRNNETVLLGLRARYGERLVIRVSLDHYTRAVHEAERGAGTWEPTLEGLLWLASRSFFPHVAGRLLTAEPEPDTRAGYQRLFAEIGLAIDASDPVRLTLFPEIDATRDVPEITTACWGILNRAPESVMCASARMIVKRKGAAGPTVTACTLLPYDARFELGRTLSEASQPVHLNHPYCASFCVLGGAACS
ncbi:MAG: radical SAM protein, partial [Acetobacteraceae bacterium]|nr:radical SAM protein [Acetobacteraceae bacterium]